VLAIPAADFVTPVQKTYDIMGSSGHTHSVTMTGAQLTSLKGGTPVTVTSTPSGHTHDVTIVCA